MVCRGEEEDMTEDDMTEEVMVEKAVENINIMDTEYMINEDKENIEDMCIMDLIQI